MGRTVGVEVRAAGDANNQNGALKLSTDFDGLDVSIEAANISKDNVPRDAVVSVSKPGSFNWAFNTESRASSFTFNSSANVMDKDVALKFSTSTGKGGAMSVFGSGNGMGMSSATTIEATTDLGSDLGELTVQHNFDKNSQSVKWNFTKDNTTLSPCYHLADNTYSLQATQNNVGQDGDSLSLYFDAGQNVSGTYEVNDLKIGVSTNLNNVAPEIRIDYSTSFDL
jgi:hypothetical protein